MIKDSGEAIAPKNQVSRRKQTSSTTLTTGGRKHKKACSILLGRTGNRSPVMPCGEEGRVGKECTIGWVRELFSVYCFGLGDGVMCKWECTVQGLQKSDALFGANLGPSWTDGWRHGRMTTFWTRANRNRSADQHSVNAVRRTRKWYLMHAGPTGQFLSDWASMWKECAPLWQLFPVCGESCWPKINVWPKTNARLCSGVRSNGWKLGSP